MREFKFRGWDGKRITNSGIMFSNSTSKESRLIIMQYIGRKDRNGKDTYEGDIVKVRGRKKVGEYLTEIIYEGCGFKLKKNETYLNDFYLPSGMFEIVGNIYENPELL